MDDFATDGDDNGWERTTDDFATDGDDNGWERTTDSFATDEAARIGYFESLLIPHKLKNEEI